MKYLKIMLAVVLLSYSTGMMAQYMSDTERLPLTVWIPDDVESIPPAAVSVLQNKLIQIATQNGITGSMDVMRFIFTANIEVITKDITPTAPAMHAYTMNVNMYIGDGIDGKAFSSYSATVKGVGENETKAYLAGLKNIKTNNPDFQRFIQEGKSKINLANNIWNAGQSWNAANDAGAVLSTIDPNSSCVGEIKVLANKIEKRIREVDQREWKFIYDYNIGLTRDWIKAYRDVGVAWGNGQPRTVIYNNFRRSYFSRRR